MKTNKQGLATLGLIFITVLAAIQYVFLRNVPDSVSTFTFICVTNVIGLVILGVAQIKKLVTLRGKTLLKGALFALELTGFNFFLLLGSRHLDALITSSVLSLYFVFITPMLLLLRKKVNFFSGIATVIAIIALLLMFGADTEKLFASKDVIYLLIADVFFAAYVVNVSVLGENEDSTQLTLAQMIFAALFSFIGWLIESSVSGSGMSLPTQAGFWISALFIGVFIRAIYGLLQITCQKYVSALKASLIFSAEIIITLLTNPILCGLMNMEYTPVTIFQIFGGILLIIATVMVDDTIMEKMGYGDLRDSDEVDEAGRPVQRTSVARKMILTTLTFAMIVLILSTTTFLSAIYLIRSSAVSNSQELGENASSISSQAMMQKLEESIQSQAADKALLAEQKLSTFSDAVDYAASYAHSLYMNPDNYPDKEVQRPLQENAGIWAMQRALENENISYDDIRAESALLGNMEDIFAPIARGNENISAIYMSTESGLMISYDPNSELGEIDSESYYEYKETSWYKQARKAQGAVFTDTYQDGYGKGLTISCVSPFTDASGHFAGVIGMDVLMSELNASMVNDGIVDPSIATLIDHEGNYIAGKDVDPLSENMGSIFDEGRNESLRQVGKEILKEKNGVVSVGEGEAAEYIAFATIDSTDWTLCILSPVSAVIQPAVEIRESIDQNTESVVGSVMKGIMNIIQSCLLLSALILLFVTLFTGRFSRRISDPLKQLESDVKSISEGNLDRRTEVRTDDEIGSLANSFNVMTDSLQKYIADLKEVTAKEQRIAGELTAATNIQASMLPRDFEAFCQGRPFELYATMHPAKEVGGDFYDYFMIDDDHLAMVMADVSGKGVPAALFMVIAKTLIKNHAQMGNYSPASVLARANEQLCEGNEGELFVTVWLAILDIRTGKGLAANAGHEHPTLRRAGGQYELVQYRHSPAVATFEGLRFREHEFELHPGDSLFVYTDGVAEATNANESLYGTDRMMAALNENPDADPKQLLTAVKRSVDEFVGDAPQFDDITMLCMAYKGIEAEGSDRA